jgi:hypothetical protein
MGEEAMPQIKRLHEKPRRHVPGGRRYGKNGMLETPRRPCAGGRRSDYYALLAILLACLPLFCPPLAAGRRAEGKLPNGWGPYLV